MREKRLIVHGTLAGIIAISVIHLAERGRRRARYAEHTFGAHDRSLRSPHAHRCVVASVFPLDPSESSHIDFRARVVRRRDIARRDASPFAVVVATRPGIVATLTPSPPVPLLQDGLRFPRHALPCRRRAPPRVRGASRLRARPRRARRGARHGGRRSRGASRPRAHRRARRQGAQGVQARGLRQALRRGDRPRRGGAPHDLLRSRTLHGSRGPFPILPPSPTAP